MVKKWSWMEACRTQSCHGVTLASCGSQAKICRKTSTIARHNYHYYMLSHQSTLTKKNGAIPFEMYVGANAIGRLTVIWWRCHLTFLIYINRDSDKKKHKPRHGRKDSYTKQCSTLLAHRINGLNKLNWNCKSKSFTSKCRKVCMQSTLTLAA